MNRGYNLLAFPRGGYLIREKREGWTAERTMDPLRPLMSGRGKKLESHNEQEEMMKMMVSVFKENEDEPSISPVCKYATSLAC